MTRPWSSPIPAAGTTPSPSGLATIDRAVLVTYVETWATLVKAEKELRTKPLTHRDKDGVLRKTPVWQIRREAVTLDSQCSAHRYIRSADKTVVGFYWQWE